MELTLEQAIAKIESEGYQVIPHDDKYRRQEYYHLWRSGQASNMELIGEFGSKSELINHINNTLNKE